MIPASTRSESNPWPIKAAWGRTFEVRFWARVQKFEGSCWIWLGAPQHAGHGRLLRGGVGVWAHRVAYELLVGPIPDGLELDHLCRVTACVNPAHLEPVTSRENTLRSPITFAGLNARKTHCLNGHEFTTENTSYTPRGGRWCRICRREKWRVWYASLPYDHPSKARKRERDRQRWGHGIC